MGYEKTVQDVYNSMNDEQKKVVAFLVGKAVEDAKGGSQADEEGGEETVNDIYHSMNEKQKKVVAFLVGKAIEDYRS